MRPVLVSLSVIAAALTLAACEGCQQRLPTVAVLPQPVVEGPRPGGCGG